jgi:putative membrane protein
MELKNIAIVPSVFVAFGGAATSAMAQVGDVADQNEFYNHGHDMMWGSSQWGGFGMVLWPTFMTLILVGSMAGVIYFLRQFGPSVSVGNSNAAHCRALALLKDRHAKGEIDSEEFTERKNLLAD